VGGESLKTYIMEKGKLVQVPDYAKVQGILIGSVAAFVLFITIIGPENHAAQFEKAKTAFEEGGGTNDIEVDEFHRDKFQFSDDEDKMSISHISHA